MEGLRDVLAVYLERNAELLRSGDVEVERALVNLGTLVHAYVILEPATFKLVVEAQIAVMGKPRSS